MFITMANLFAKKITVYPFSAFEGQLFYKGKPASHAKVTRTYDWDGTLNEETIEADAEGRFAFESVSVETKESLNQFVSSQEIYVLYDDQKFEIWGAGKIAEEEFGEFGGKPENLSCELTDEPRAVQLPRGYVGTSCFWDAIKSEKGQT